MKRLILVITILFCIISSCNKGSYELGGCDIYYDNISKFPSNNITVTVIDRVSDSTWATDHINQYTLTPTNNLLRLYFDKGYSFQLIIPDIRHDSIYEVKIVRTGNLDKLEDYSFKFNESTYDSKNHIIHIQL